MGWVGVFNGNKRSVGKGGGVRLQSWNADERRWTTASDASRRRATPCIWQPAVSSDNDDNSLIKRPAVWTSRRRVPLSHSTGNPSNRCRRGQPLCSAAPNRFFWPLPTRLKWSNPPLRLAAVPLKPRPPLVLTSKPGTNHSNAVKTQ